MSLYANTELLERAQECISYFEGKLPAQILEQDVANGDLEALRAHLIESEAEMSRQEFYTGNVL